MNVLAVLGQFHRTRGHLAWRFCEGADGTFFALRQDGRKFAYDSKESMREGYALLKAKYRYSPVCLLSA